MTTDAVAVLRIADVAVSVPWYRRLGFEQTFLHRFEPELPAYVGLRREGAQIHLSEHTGDAPPNGLVYLWVGDVAAVAAEFAVPIDDQPWAKEVGLVDPDGNRIRVAQPAVEPSADEVLGAGAVEQLIELERAMWSEATRGDRSWLDDHLSDSCTEFGWSGRAYDRFEILDHDTGVIDAELQRFFVRPVGRDAALVTYRSAQPRGAGHRSSLWVRHEGRWLLEFHQGTPAPD